MRQEIAMRAWLQAIRRGEKAALATVLELSGENNRKQQAAHRLYIGLEEIAGQLGSEEAEEKLIQIARQKFSKSTPKSEWLTIQTGEAELDIFLDIHIPEIEVMIFGAGHDAVPMAAFSVASGFHTTVVDVRTGYNQEERFPGTERIIARPEHFAEKVTITDRTYVIVMNHHIEKDEQTLKFVLQSDSPYVGVLGPRSRRERMLERLEEEGVTFSADAYQKMYSPIGLDIGARSPEEIAISVLAEIIAIKNGHTAGFLKGADAIHK